MKFNSGEFHLCGDCGTDPCEYHDCDKIIDGWDMEISERGYYKIKKCPHFTDGSDCKSCANFTKCKLMLPYGKACNLYVTRAKKSARNRLVDEIKTLSMNMTPDECEAVYNFVIGLKMGDTRLEYQELQDEMHDRVKRLKAVRNYGRKKK